MVDSDDDMNLLSTLREEEDNNILIQDPKPKEGDELKTNHYHLQSINTALLLRQLPSQGLSFQLWPAANTLVSLLDHNPSKLLFPDPSTPAAAKLRILELGSGTGLVGIAAAAVLGARVTLTDLPHVLPNLRFNAQSNASAIASNGGEIEVRQLRWGEEEDMDGLNAFDVVMASDVVYYDHLFEPLLRTVEVFVKGEVGFVMAHLRRWKKRDAVFFRKARKLFDVVVLHNDAPLPGSRIGVVVYRFTAKKAKKR
ncbi:uncharacterized protein [Typha latifolia]|uniref:uncharacterized protein n=1 Tax=Typha latifolia TaxID=4733 RepID=UPI003C2D5162